MNIDWSKLITKEQLEEKEKLANKITISRTQGLLWIFRNTGVKDTDILLKISEIENEITRYEAEKYFEASTWDSNNVYVEMIAESIGLDSYEKIQQAFKEAITI